LIAAGSSTVFGGDLIVTSFSDFAGQTNIVLQATGDIIFSGGSMNLPPLPPGASSGLLSIQAGNDIFIQDGTSISAGQGWSLSFLAGNSLSGLPTIWSSTPDPGATITIEAGGQGGFITLESGPAVPLGPPAQLILLDSQINGANVTAVAGTNVLFLDIVDDISSCSFQWFKNGRKLHGETNDVLALTNIRLTDAGNYSVVVSNGGSWVRSNVRLHVVQPPHGARFRQLRYSNQHQPH
jgi:hypothetical protein